MRDLHHNRGMTLRAMGLLLLCITFSRATTPEKRILYPTQCKGDVCIITMPGKVCKSKCRGNRCLTECTGPSTNKSGPPTRSPKSLVKTKVRRPPNELLTLGINYIFPMLKFQFGISRH